MTDPGTATTTVAMGRAELLLVWVGFPSVGAAAGWTLVLAAGWIASLPLVPFGPALRWLDGPGPWPPAVAVCAGVLAGLALAATAVHESLEVRVTDSSVVLGREGRTHGVERARVAAVFLDGKDLVLADGAGAELARERTDLTSARLAGALAARRAPDARDLRTELARVGVVVRDEGRAQYWRVVR